MLYCLKNENVRNETVYKRSVYMHSSKPSFWSAVDWIWDVEPMYGLRPYFSAPFQLTCTYGVGFTSGKSHVWQKTCPCCVCTLRQSWSVPDSRRFPCSSRLSRGIRNISCSPDGLFQWQSRWSPCWLLLRGGIELGQSYLWPSDTHSCLGTTPYSIRACDSLNLDPFCVNAS